MENDCYCDCVYCQRARYGDKANPADVIEAIKSFDIYWIAQLIDLINENSAKLGFKAVPNDR